MDKSKTKQEQLDDLNLNGPQLFQSLDSLAWINKWLGNYRYLTRAILETIQENNIKSIILIDIGCGGGDFLRHLAKIFEAKGIKYDLIGIDGNQNSLNYARSQSLENKNIKYQQADLLDSSFELSHCDILVSSHFIYHYSKEALKDFLRKNLKVVSLSFINSGLENNDYAVFLFRWFSFLLPISKSARKDGLIALSNSFRKETLEEVLKELPTYHGKIDRVPFFRLLLQIRC